MGPGPHLPGGCRQAARRAGTHGRLHPGGARRRRVGLPQLRAGPGGALARRRRAGLPRWPSIPAPAPADPAERHRRAARAARPPAGRGSRAGRVRADRGGAPGRTPAPCARRSSKAADATSASTAPSSGSPTARYAHTFIVFARDPDDRDSPARSSSARGAQGFSDHPRGGEARPALLQHRRPAVRAHARRAARRAGPRACASRCRRSTAGASASPRRRSASRRPRSTSRPPTRRSATTFGRPIGAHQAIPQKLADMRPRSRPPARSSIAPRALKNAGKPHTVEGAQAKLFASGVARR